MSHSEIEIKSVSSETVAFLPMRGPYSQIPEAMGRLYGWIAQHGLQPAGMPGATYYTAPGEASESEALWELHTAVAGAVPDAEPDTDGCGIRTTDAVTVATTMHKGPYEAIEPTYEDMGAWVSAHGYVMAGPPQEFYYSDPAEVPPEEYLTEIRFPVARL